MSDSHATHYIHNHFLGDRTFCIQFRYFDEKERNFEREPKACEHIECLMKDYYEIMLMKEIAVRVMRKYTHEKLGTSYRDKDLPGNNVRCIFTFDPQKGKDYTCDDAISVRVSFDIFGKNKNEPSIFNMASSPIYWFKPERKPAFSADLNLSIQDKATVANQEKKGISWIIKRTRELTR